MTTGNTSTPEFTWYDTFSWLCDDSTVRRELHPDTTDEKIACLARFLEAKLMYEMECTSKYIEEVLRHIRDTMQWIAGLEPTGEEQELC